MKYPKPGEREEVKEARADPGSSGCCSGEPLIEAVPLTANLLKQ